MHATAAARFICSHCSCDCNWHERRGKGGTGGREGGVLPPLLSRAGHREMADADCKGGEVLSKRNEKWVAIESVTSSRE